MPFTCHRTLSLAVALNSEHMQKELGALKKMRVKGVRLIGRLQLGKKQGAKNCNFVRGARTSVNNTPLRTGCNVEVHQLLNPHI